MRHAQIERLLALKEKMKNYRENAHEAGIRTNQYEVDMKMELIDILLMGCEETDEYVPAPMIGGTILSGIKPIPNRVR